MICILVPQQVLTVDTIWHFRPAKKRCSSTLPWTIMENILMMKTNEWKKFVLIHQMFA